MRNSCILLLLLLAPLLALSQGTSVRFQLQGAPAGTYRVIGMFGGQNYLADSIVVSKAGGEILWSRPGRVPGGLYYLVFPDQQTFVQMLLDEDQVFNMKGVLPDLTGSLQVDGSLDNALFYENQRWEQQFRRRLDSIDLALKAQSPGSPNLAYLENQKNQLLGSRKSHIESFKINHPTSFFTVFKIAGQNPELQSPRLPSGGLDTLRQLYLYRQAYWVGTDLSDERLLRTPVIPNKLKTFITQLIPQNTDSLIRYADDVIAKSQKCAECLKYVVNWIAIQYEKPSFMGGEAILVHLVDKYFTDEHSNWFKDKPEELIKIRKKVNEMRPSLIGKTGQDLRCKNIAGGYESLYDIKGPAKILYLYSTSCSHCQERTPVLRQVYEQWKAQGLEVYALCLDPDEEKWKQFVVKYQMEPFHNLIDPKYESGYYKKYHVDITPELYILDANNKIIAKDLHPNQIGPILEKAYGVK